LGHVLYEVQLGNAMREHASIGVKAMWVVEHGSRSFLPILQPLTMPNRNIRVLEWEALALSEENLAPVLAEGERQARLRVKAVRFLPLSRLSRFRGWPGAYGFGRIWVLVSIPDAGCGKP
jgi:hypothetical protein